MIAKVDLQGLDSIMQSLDPSVIKKATKRTLDELMRGGMTAAQKEVTSHYNMKTSDLKRYIGSRVVARDGLEVSVSIRSQGYVSMFNFINKLSIQSPLTRKNKNSKAKSKVKVKIIKGGGVHTFRHAFVMIGKSGNIGIFERVRGVKSSTGNAKITRLNTIGPIVMFEKVGLPIIQKYVDDKTSDIFRRNLDFFMTQAATK